MADLESFDVVSAYLFGSHAEDRAHVESDVDIRVLLRHAAYPDESARFDARLDLTSKLSIGLGSDAVDVVILNDAPPLLARRIVTTGRRLMCRDAAADHAFVRDVQLRAADVEPFLRRMARRKLAVIAR
jgi:predicted nucleotidyltransferase